MLLLIIIIIIITVKFVLMISIYIYIYKLNKKLIERVLKSLACVGIITLLAI